MKKRVLILMCAATMISMAACGAKETVTTEATKAVVETTLPESESVEEIAGMPNPWTDCKTLDEAKDNTGFSIEIPGQIKGYTQTLIQTLEKQTIQVFYEKGGQTDQEILIRKGIGTEDISGDYNTYDEEKQTDIAGYQVQEKGDNGKIMLATWTNDGYTYSVSAPGISENEMEIIIQQIK